MLPQVNPLQCALAKFVPATPLQGTLAKILGLNPFRFRTYKKGGRGVRVGGPFLSIRAERATAIPRSEFFRAQKGEDRPQSQEHTVRRARTPAVCGVLASRNPNHEPGRIHSERDTHADW